MQSGMKRREFLKLAGISAILPLGTSGNILFGAVTQGSKLISPGCRTSKVKVARIYIANPDGLWPRPDLDLGSEVKFYQDKFSELGDQLSDVDFIVDELITTPEQAAKVRDKAMSADGLLVVHLTLGIRPILAEVLDMGMPIMGGAEAYPHLREARPQLKVIVCSGYELDASSQALLDAGASAFLQKPFRATALAQTLRRVLEA